MHASKKFNIFHFWYFLDKSFRYEPYLFNGCRDLMEKAINFNNVTVVSVKGNYYKIHFWFIIKNDLINIMTNSDLNEKNEFL